MRIRRPTCAIHDPLAKRVISIEKGNSNTTVVFNPWKEMPDLAADDWHEMLAVETVNAGVNAVTLAPGRVHTMTSHVTVTPAG